MNRQICIEDQIAEKLKDVCNYKATYIIHFNYGSIEVEEVHDALLKPTIDLNVGKHTTDVFDVLQYIDIVDNLEIKPEYQIIYIPEVETSRVRVEKYLLSTGELVETTYEPLTDGLGNYAYLKNTLTHE